MKGHEHAALLSHNIAALNLEEGLANFPRRV
jgi:hypothetical protein